MERGAERELGFKALPPLPGKVAGEVRISQNSIQRIGKCLWSICNQQFIAGAYVETRNELRYGHHRNSAGEGLH
jgi:hypothetical protein